MLPVEGCKWLIPGFENIGLSKKIIALYLSGKYVNSNKELRGVSFNSGYYCFWFISTASVTTSKSRLSQTCHMLDLQTMKPVFKKATTKIFLLIMYSINMDIFIISQAVDHFFWRSTLVACIYCVSAVFFGAHLPLFFILCRHQSMAKASLIKTNFPLLRKKSIC